LPLACNFLSGGLNANPVEPGSQGIVRLAHPYQLGNTEILRKSTSITIISQLLMLVKPGCPEFAPVASD